MPFGAEIQVNTYTTNKQNAPASVALYDGRYVVTWSSEQDGSLTGVYAQIFESDGTPSGDEFRVNIETYNHQEESTIAALDDGGFVIAWQSRDQDGDNLGCFATIYNADGTVRNAEFLITTTLIGPQFRPDITNMNDGGFIVAWASDNIDGDSSGIAIQRFDSAGTRVAGEVNINTETTNLQTLPSITSLTYGSYVVTWVSYQQDGSGFGVYAQMYNSAGTAIGTEFKVNDYTSSSQLNTYVTGLADGGFVITWDSAGSDGNAEGIVGKIYEDDGTLRVADFQVNSFTTGVQNNASVTALTGGDFVVVWQSDAQDGDDFGIYGQRYSSTGVVQGGEFIVNTTTSGAQDKPFVSAQNDGGFVVSWVSDGQDGSSEGVFSRIFRGSEEPTGNLIINGTFEVGEVLTVDASVIGDPDGLNTPFQYTWYRDGEYISGTNVSEYTLTANDANRDISVRVFFTDGSGYAEHVQSASQTVVPPIGSEIRVNTHTISAQYASRIVTLSDGKFVVTWQSLDQDGDSWGIYGQIHNADGTTVGSEFQINTYTSLGQTGQNVAALSDGGFVVSWQSDAQDGDVSGVFGQVFNADGTMQGVEFLVNNVTTVSSQEQSSIAGLNDGGFVVLWSSASLIRLDLYGQRYNADGTENGAEFLVSETTFNHQQASRVDGLASGGFIAVWDSTITGGQEIYGRVFDANGIPETDDFRINTYGKGGQFVGDVAQLADGGFVAAWASNDSDHRGVYSQVFNAVGIKVGVEENVFSEIGDAPQITALSDGGFVIVNGLPYGDGSGIGVYGQVFNADGSKKGSVFLINNTTSDNQDYPDVAALDNSSFVVSWTSNTQDGSSQGIYTKIFDFDGVIIDATVDGEVLYGTDDRDRLHGSDGDDTFYGGNGNDEIIGGFGNDKIYAGKGNDIVKAGYGDDYVRAGGGKEYFDGGLDVDTISYYKSSGGVKLNLANNTASGSWAENDTVLNFENVYASKTGNDHITGTSGVNYIKTYGGNDKVYAGDGNDIVKLGDGNDYVKAAGGTDYFDGGSGVDTISYYDSLLGVKINLATNSASQGDAEGDTVKNFENVYASKLGNDHITGADGANYIKTYAGNDKVYAGDGNDIVKLGDGNDYVKAGGGTDYFDGGSGVDTISYYDSADGVKINLATNTASQGDAEGDTVKNFENVNASKVGNDHITGTDGANYIKTYGGNDKVYAGLGNDIVKLGDGDDYAKSIGGIDYFDGGDGVDTISYYTSTVGVKINLATNTASLGEAEGDTVKNFENVYASKYGDDHITGTSGANYIKTYGGNDKVYAGGGDDLIKLGDGDDYVKAGGGNDIIYGGDGADKFDAGGGDDIIYGGAGADKFHYDFGEDHDTIKDFENNIDTIELDNSGYADVAEAMTHATQVGADVVFDFGGGDGLTIENATLSQLTNDLMLV